MAEKIEITVDEAESLEAHEDCRGMANCMDCWLDWLKQEVSTDG